MAELQGNPDSVVSSFTREQRGIYQAAPEVTISNSGPPQGSVFDSLMSSINAIETEFKGKDASGEARSFLEAILKCTRKGTRGKDAFADLLKLMREYVDEKNSEVRLSKTSSSENFDTVVIGAKIFDICFKIREAYLSKNTAAYENYKQDRGPFLNTLKTPATDTGKAKDPKFVKNFSAVEEWEKANLIK